ncbi:hypothetical protein EV356DRAFT_537456 [Viridothelium virens]|uniref:PH domain-containing protein n=1 Tax=Viridothelium virens TaxID=1048519 RepID=A0A6A6GTZ1_VIRVR|nr:hypothetical protein EV356DRAFT_537456 [Viridothelium virens]
MSQWGYGAPRSPTTSSPSSPTTAQHEKKGSVNTATITPTASTANLIDLSSPSPTPRPRARSEAPRPASRPVSMLMTYQPPIMGVDEDTPAELQPIFTFLNSHANKLYQEGYFLKLHDLDSRGRPSPDRNWVECFAQLVGTVLSLWDAAALDAAGEDGEVVPMFINLSDASIKMIESLPMNGQSGGSLQNVLSVSTAANNRYLLHFNSLSSLTQWTAGIRLAMFEHATLQEAYTGSLIAGKGKMLNNIRQIMERSRFITEDWVRVRFGAGTPWKRCWCVISPPNEKEYQKLQKSLKKRPIYDRSTPILKGDVKFYETKKITKKTQPIVTITDAFSCYSIYPQSKPLIDQSTLIKLEGLITAHGPQDTTTEGFIFVMPEVHPAVSGFEIMLRWLFPVFDTFGLYGRPSRLVADVRDTRSLMFALPSSRRYGYLDILDVAGLIHEKGSSSWSEREWRKQMKSLTSHRMTNGVADGSRSVSRAGGRRATESRAGGSLSRNGGVRFDETSSTPSSPRRGSPTRPGDSASPIIAPQRVDSAPPVGGFQPPSHQRSVSEAQGYRKYQSETPSRLSHEESASARPPVPPTHAVSTEGSPERAGMFAVGLNGVPHSGDSPEREGTMNQQQLAAEMSAMHLQPTSPPPGPVAAPPAMAHNARGRPQTKLYHPADLQRAHSDIDEATLAQMRDANQQASVMAGPNPRSRSAENKPTGLRQTQPQIGPLQRDYMNPAGMPADGLNHPKIMQSRNQAGFGAPKGLPTIPASPYVDDNQFPHGPVGVPAGPPVPTHGQSVPSQQEERTAPLDNMSIPTSIADRLGQSSLKPKHSITRKPIGSSPVSSKENLSRPGDPQQPDSSQIESARSESMTSSLGSLRNHVIDESALDSIVGQALDPGLQRQGTKHTTTSESIYSDNSNTTPDYASTIEEELPPARPVDKPRMGTMKTVGNIEDHPTNVNIGDVTYKPNQKIKPTTDIPNIDFGPTYALAPDGRPGTSGTMSPSGHTRNKSTDRLSAGSPAPLRDTPQDDKRSSYFGGRTTPSPHIRSGSRSPLDDAESPDNRNSVFWQPAQPLAEDIQSKRQSLTPEQWVQYRASMAAVPVYSHHQRQGSHTPTPPGSRNVSGDWTQNRSSSRIDLPARPGSRNELSSSRPGSRQDMLNRRGSRELLQRPSSRGSGMLLNRSDTDPAGHLSAREQEYVARASGSPLINLAQNARQPSPNEGNGLVGAIAQREQDRQRAKAGMSSAAIQNAVQANLVNQQREERRQQQIQRQQALEQQRLVEHQRQVEQQKVMMEQQRLMEQERARQQAASLQAAQAAQAAQLQWQQAQQAQMAQMQQLQYQQQQQQQQMMGRQRASWYGGQTPGTPQQQMPGAWPAQTPGQMTPGQGTPGPGQYGYGYFQQQQQGGRR